ncbi:MAG TPA: carboxymuconolactone decarboxylase family protein [Roseiarcus sp.]
MGRHRAAPDGDQRYRPVRRRVAAAGAQLARPQPHFTVASLIALYRSNELPFHLGKALENGVTRDEIIEMITHLAFYSGWPTASTAIGIARQVLPTTAQEPTQSKGAPNADA